MSDYIFLIVGASGSGKSAISRILQKDYGLKAVQSYTTRPPRYEGEEGHTFVSEEEYADLVFSSVACTEIGGYHYCATKHQVDTSDLYVIDPDGVMWLNQCYGGYKMPVVLYIDVSRKVRKERMCKRGDSPEEVSFRLKHDRKEFAWFARRARRQLLPYLSFVIDNNSDDINIAIADALNIIGSLTSDFTEDKQ